MGLFTYLLPYFYAVFMFFWLNNLNKPETFGKLRYQFTKTTPLLVLSLISWITITDEITRNLMVLGNLFSALGDFFLGQRDQSLVKFTAAVIPFMCAHFFYITSFYNGHHWNAAGLLVVGSTTLVSFTFRRIPDYFLRLLLPLYGLILSLALWLALSEWHFQVGSEDSFKALVRVIGYGEFYISDVLIVLNWAKIELPFASQSVLGLYYMGQLLIYLGHAL